MESLTIDLNEDLASRIKVAADKLGIQPNELVKIGIQEKLELLDQGFQEASNYVLNKNNVLYQRLA